jgi:hypothetical protein
MSQPTRREALAAAAVAALATPGTHVPGSPSPAHAGRERETRPHGPDQRVQQTTKNLLAKWIG